MQYYNAFWETAGVPGTGLTVSCTIGNYIQSVPVINGGSGFTRPPTFTISDSGTGTGAAAVAVMSGPLPTDVLTYFATSGWLTTKVQSTSGSPVLPATNAFVTNWVGQLRAYWANHRVYRPAIHIACWWQRLRRNALREQYLLHGQEQIKGGHAVEY